MKCPIDQTAMEVGFVGQMGQLWKKGKPFGSGVAAALGSGEYIYAYKCPKCGKVELTTKGEE